MVEKNGQKIEGLMEIEGFEHKYPMLHVDLDKFGPRVSESVRMMWFDLGLGTFMDGYLCTVPMGMFEDFANRSFFQGLPMVPLFMTAFGDVIAQDPEGVLYMLKHRHEQVEVLAKDLDTFLELIKDEAFVAAKFELDRYKEAVAALGKLEYWQCYAAFPILPFAGTEEISSLKIVSAPEYLSFLVQAIGFEME